MTLQITRKSHKLLYTSSALCGNFLRVLHRKTISFTVSHEAQTCCLATPLRHARVSRVCFGQELKWPGSFLFSPNVTHHQVYCAVFKYFFLSFRHRFKSYSTQCQSEVYRNAFEWLSRKVIEIAERQMSKRNKFSSLSRN